MIISKDGYPCCLLFDRREVKVIKLPYSVGKFRPMRNLGKIYTEKLYQEKILCMAK